MTVLCINGAVKLFVVQHYRFLCILLDAREVQRLESLSQLQCRGLTAAKQR
jgi:hypothetical protein